MNPHSSSSKDNPRVAGQSVAEGEASSQAERSEAIRYDSFLFISRNVY